MKITYTGRQVELAPAQVRKIDALFSKVGKLLDGKEEKEAHVILSQERHLNHAEVTVNYHNHPLVGIGTSTDVFTALHSAAEKLEKQAIKVRAKWREGKRMPRKPENVDAIATVAATAEEQELEFEGERRIHRVNHHQNRKPMTLDEAILEMEGDRDYLVYLDADTDRVSVLLRRRDGDFDLVQA